jgi:hypothetical protein
VPFYTNMKYTLTDILACVIIIDAYFIHMDILISFLYINTQQVDNKIQQRKMQDG